MGASSKHKKMLSAEALALAEPCAAQNAAERLSLEGSKAQDPEESHSVRPCQIYTQNTGIKKPGHHGILKYYPITSKVLQNFIVQLHIGPGRHRFILTLAEGSGTFQTQPVMAPQTSAESAAEARPM